MLSVEGNKNLPHKHKIVAQSLRVGKENSMLLSDIMTIARIDERRKAYQIMEDLVNKHGYAICANRKGKHKGYFIPGNDDEFKEVAGQFKSSIDSMNKRYENLLINYTKRVKSKNSV